jgi:hypothetical protein
MRRGPKTKQMASAVTIAYAARNVMYRNTLKYEKVSCRGYNR